MNLNLIATRVTFRFVQGGEKNVIKVQVTLDIDPYPFRA